MDLERFGEIVRTSVVGNIPVTAEQVEATLTDEEILQAVERRGLAVGSLATPEALSDLPDGTTDTASEAAPVETDLTPEQHERATSLQTALAEKFSTDERKLTPEDFGVVAVGTGEAQTVLVMLTTGNGLYRGSYNQIMSDKKANVASYTIEVDGQKVDTRKAMTWEAYQAFIARAEAPLPDSTALRAENGEPWTATWLTGEQPDDLDAQYGDVSDGGPYRNWSTRDDDWNSLWFRPAAVV